MSKLSSDDLFLLIKSLNRSEKRYFKIYASRHVIGRENNYVKLFDSIDAQKEYDEQELLKKGKYIRRLALLKAHLYKVILESLEGYGAGIDYKLRSMLNQAEFLFRKGLNKQHLKLLDKAYAMAVKRDRYNYIAEIAGERMQMISYLSNGFDINGIKENWVVKQQALTNAINTETYKKLYYEFVFYRHKIDLHPNKKQLAEIDELMASPFIKNENNAITPESKSYFQLIHQLYCLIINNWEKAYIHTKKRIQIFQSHPQLIISKPNKYIACLRHILNLCCALKKYKEANIYLENLRTAPSKYKFEIDKRVKAHIFNATYELEIDKNLFLGEFEKGCKLISDVERGLEEFSDIITATECAFFYLNIALLCFGAKRFKESLKWINRVRAIPRDRIEEDVYYTALINSLIVHYELKNYDTLPFVIRSTYRYLLKKERLFTLERTILDFIRKKIPGINGHKELINAFKILKVEIEKIMSDPNITHPLPFIDYVYWIESKIENKSYAEVVKEKSEKIMKGKQIL